MSRAVLLKATAKFLFKISREHRVLTVIAPMTDRNESMKGKPKDACSSSDDSDEEPTLARCSKYPKTANEPPCGSESDFRPFEGGNTNRDDHLAEHRTGEHAQSANIDEGNTHHRSSSTHTSESPGPAEEVAHSHRLKHSTGGQVEW